MRVLVIVLAGLYHLLQSVLGRELTVTRFSDGDIFTIEGPCTDACMVLSSGTADVYRASAATAASDLVASSNHEDTCTCRCEPGLPVFREDLHICVNNINECDVAGFISANGQIERVPYVFLPQRGQIVYPHAEIHFEDVTTPVCGIAGAKQLGKAGWYELRNLSDADPPFRLFHDEGRTFLQWVGESELRDATEGRVVITKLVCRDASPSPNNPGVFTPCVAFRVAGSPSRSNVREVTFASTPHTREKLSTIEYTAIGVSSVILAVIYVASVSLYLHSRRSKRKNADEAEAPLPPPSSTGQDAGLIKNNPLLVARHFDSDGNSAFTESDLAEDFSPSDGEQNFENVTSAVVHPRCIYLDHSESAFSSGTILGERLPEEDVRVVETIDNSLQQDAPLLPGAQRRKLYFNPAYFDRQLLLAPPPAAIEFLLKIREVISIAKHKMAAKKFVPSLDGIPEEENESEHCSTISKRYKTTNSVQSSAAKSKKSQRCSGCPGCSENPRPLPALPERYSTSPGESKVRAWLEDVKPPHRRWREIDEDKQSPDEKIGILVKDLDYFKRTSNRDVTDSKSLNFTSKSLSSWKDNPPMLQTFRNIARSEILEYDNDDIVSVSQRSTKSMFEDSNRHRQIARGFVFDGNDAINAKVRKAIENSFIKQMEENAVMEMDKKSNVAGESDTRKIEKTEVPARKRNKKKNAPPIPRKDLPDMINELPLANNTAKRIMDAVIKEMVDVKAVDRIPKIVDYEVDSLERSKINRKTSTSPESTDQSSPPLSTALPMDEELTIQNAVINANTGEMTMSKLKSDVLQKNYYNNLSELVYSQKPETYSLVSEVYVNDGYASPTNSDDSGPEIQYEPENPGHLTIRVQDSPKNYVKHDESEYEPDTLDRKPMRLKINSEETYNRDYVNEVYVDSLERPAQILLKSKGSFRDENGTPRQRGYSSLREIYEARLRASLDKDIQLYGNYIANNEKKEPLSWEKIKYLTPEMRQAKRQRRPNNRPDVIPLPPSEEIYQRPKPPRPVDNLTEKALTKNEWDRSHVVADDPTADDGTPVHARDPVDVGGSVLAGKQTARSRQRARQKLGTDSLMKLKMQRVEDSGYLSSTDSNGSGKRLLNHDIANISETDETESVCDGASESGAESIGTDSVFYGNFRKSLPMLNFSREDNRMEKSILTISDSEAESFVTVLSPNACKTKSFVS